MPSKAPKGRNFCLTINNYREDDLEKLKAIEWIVYGIFGKEVGASGTPHLQGYIQLDRKIKKTASSCAKAIREKGVSSPHCILARGSYHDNVQYCSKDENVTEWGIPSKGKGSRTDIKKFIEKASKVRTPEDEKALKDEMPATWGRYYKAGREASALDIRVEARKEHRFKYEKLRLREWQKNVREDLLEQNDRTVTWLVDAKGGMGKSTLAHYLQAVDKAFIVTNGKSSDIAHAYKKTMAEIVVFDFTRDLEEYVNYQVIESFKDGRLFCPKYDAEAITFKPAKVLVCSNWEPNREKLSSDRWDIRHLKQLETSDTTSPPRRRKRRRQSMEAEDEEKTDALEGSFKRMRLMEDFVFE